jgi:hypothetical protein
MPLTNVCASNQFGIPNQTDVFFIDNRGALRAAWATEAWNPPISISTPGIAPHGAPVAACQKVGTADQTNVFFVNNAGALCVAWVNGSGPWQGPSAITAAGTAPAGASVAAASQFGASYQTGVFFVNSAGAVCVVSSEGDGPWSGPSTITAAGYAPPGAPVAVSDQLGIPDQTDVFFVNNAGALCVVWVGGGGVWGGPTLIGGAGTAPPGASVAASNQFGVSDRTDVFFVSSAGAVSAAWVDGSGAWNAPIALTPTGYAPPGAPVAASNQFGIFDQTDVFFVNNAGALSAVWVNGSGGWNGPSAITATGYAPPGAPVAASNQFGVSNQTDVFFENNAGALCVAWVASNTWHAPTTLYQPTLSAWAGEYQTQSATSSGFGADYFSPLVIHSDGSMNIASTPVALTFTQVPSPVVTFASAPIRSTIASGSIEFTLSNGQPTLAGTITPYPGAAPLAITGTRQTEFPTPSLTNLVDADSMLEAASQCYLAASTGGWIVAAGDQQALAATAPVPALAQVFTVESTEGDGFYLAVAGTPTQYVSSANDGQGAPLVLGTTPGTFHIFASINGYAALGDSTGRYWTLSGQSVVMQTPAALGAPMLFTVGVVPALGAGAQQVGAAAAYAPAVTACDMAVATLVWQVTGGLFLAFGLGPYIGSGVVAPGITGLIRMSTAGDRALTLFLQGVRQNPDAVIVLTTAFLSNLYDAGLLWPVVKFLLAFVGWQVLFLVLAKILELILLPEVEAAILLASFVVWSAQAVLAATVVATECSG